jgi:hypothetical protein
MISGTFLIMAVLMTPPSALDIQGAFVHTKTLSLHDISSLAHRTVRVREHNGATARYIGVSLIAILRSNGFPAGELRGPLARTYLAVEGSDEYVAVYSLAELETREARCVPILAYARNGAPITPALGPLHVIAPCDRAWSRWVRDVVRLTVITAAVPALSVHR